MLFLSCSALHAFASLTCSSVESALQWNEENAVYRNRRNRRNNNNHKHNVVSINTVSKCLDNSVPSSVVRLIRTIKLLVVVWRCSHSSAIQFTFTIVFAFHVDVDAIFCRFLFFVLTFSSRKNRFSRWRQRLRDVRTSFLSHFFVFFVCFFDFGFLFSHCWCIALSFLVRLVFIFIHSTESTNSIWSMAAQQTHKQRQNLFSEMNFRVCFCCISNWKWHDEAMCMRARARARIRFVWRIVQWFQRRTESNERPEMNWENRINKGSIDFQLIRN